MASLLNLRTGWPPCPTAEDAVDETPWALLGEAPRGESHDPWQDDHNDVEPNSPTFLPSRPRPNFILYPAGPPTPANQTLGRSFQAQAHARAHAHALNTRPSFLSSPPPSSSSAAETFNQPDVPLSRRSRLARHQRVLAARRTMDYCNDGVEYVRGTYNAVVHTVSTVYNAATSKTAQRTLLTTVLFAFLSAILFGFACVAYLAFYHEYLPDQVMTVPVHLQYGYELNPYGVASLSSANFKDYQDYDISVTLNLPNSPANLGRGNFMLALYLLDNVQSPASNIMSTMTGSRPMPTIIPAPQSVLNEKNILFTSTRPAIMPYTDPLVSLAKRLLLLAYHVFVPASETTRLVVPMVERLEFRPGKMMPTSLVLDVQAGQSLQVYDVLVTVTAQLGGLRWLMHTWWITSFVVFTALFWLFELISLATTAVAAKILWSVFFGGGGGRGAAPPGQIKEEGGQHPRIKVEGQGHGKALEDVPMTFPTSSQQPPLRYDPEPGHTNGVEDGVGLPQQPQADVGGEADVEDEEAGDDRLEEDPQGRDSGIGTSFSERDASGSVRRRTSLRRM